MQLDKRISNLDKAEKELLYREIKNKLECVNDIIFSLDCKISGLEELFETEPLAIIEKNDFDNADSKYARLIENLKKMNKEYVKDAKDLSEKHTTIRTILDNLTLNKDESKVSEKALLFKIKDDYYGINENVDFKNNIQKNYIILIEKYKEIYYLSSEINGLSDYYLKRIPDFLNSLSKHSKEDYSDLIEKTKELIEDSNESRVKIEFIKKHDKGLDRLKSIGNLSKNASGNLNKDILPGM